MQPDAILQLRETFARGAKDYQAAFSSSANSYGAFILSDGTLGTVGPWVCHGWLRDENFPKYLRMDNLSARLTRTSPIYILSAVMYLHTSRAFALNYINWLVNDSNWAEVFVDKDPERIMRLGYLVDANHPSNFIASAFVASRFLTESYSGAASLKLRHKVYDRLLSLGCTRNEAFIFAHMYTPETEFSLYPVVPMLFNTGHTPFSYNGLTQIATKNFLTNTKAHLNKGTIAGGFGYPSNSISRVWGEPPTYEDKFWQTVRGLQPKKVTKSVDHNIFRKIKLDGMAYSSDEDFMSVITQLKGIIYA